MMNFKLMNLLMVIDHNFYSPSSTPIDSSSPSTSLNPINSLPSTLVHNSRSSLIIPKKWHSLKEIYEQLEWCQFAGSQELSCFEDGVQIKECCTTMNEEFKALRKHETWELVNLPSNKKRVGLKWIYKLKFRLDGSV